MQADLIPGATPGGQLVNLLLLAIPVACVSWTVTHEHIFSEVHDWCERKSQRSSNVLVRKFFYLFTCEYCFSHYVTAAAILLTRFTLLFGGWRGYILAGFSVIWIANVYMSLYGRLRLNIKHERHEIAVVENELEKHAARRPKERAAVKD
ncbi:MAG TPA: hypothetical protein VGI92_08755 [Gemmatimonadales bacterium]